MIQAETIIIDVLSGKTQSGDFFQLKMHFCSHWNIFQWKNSSLSETAKSNYCQDNKTSRNESSFLQYLPLFWPVQQSRAAVEHTLSLSQNKPISWCTYCYTYAQCSSYSIIERHGSKAKMVLSLLIPLILLLVCPF